MSSATTSAPGGVEPDHHQPPFPPPAPASAPRLPPAADHHGPNGLDPQATEVLQPPRPSPGATSAPSLPGSTGALAASPTDAHYPDVSVDADATPALPQRQLRSPKARASSETFSDYSELAAVVQRTPASAVRQAVRDHWEKCLMGSDYHLTFLVSSCVIRFLLIGAANHPLSPPRYSHRPAQMYAVFQRASSATFNRAVQQFGKGMVTSAKQSIMAHLTSQDFDELADAMLPKLSNEFLDKVLARRLETIRARPLVNALARAERLGYNVRDIVEERTANGAEHVVPSLGPLPALSLPQPPPGTQPGPRRASAPSRPEPGSRPTQSPRHVPSATPSKGTNQHGIIHCNRCGRPCSGELALHYVSRSLAFHYIPSLTSGHFA